MELIVMISNFIAFFSLCCFHGKYGHPFARNSRSCVEHYIIVLAICLRASSAVEMMAAYLFQRSKGCFYWSNLLEILNKIKLEQ